MTNHEFGNTPQEVEIDRLQGDGFEELDSSYFVDLASEFSPLIVSLDGEEILPIYYKFDDDDEDIVRNREPNDILVDYLKRGYQLHASRVCAGVQILTLANPDNDLPLNSDPMQTHRALGSYLDQLFKLLGYPQDSRSEYGGKLGISFIFTGSDFWAKYNDEKKMRDPECEYIMCGSFVAYNDTFNQLETDGQSSMSIFIDLPKYITEESLGPDKNMHYHGFLRILAHEFTHLMDFISERQLTETAHRLFRERGLVDSGIVRDYAWYKSQELVACLGENIFRNDKGGYDLDAMKIFAELLEASYPHSAETIKDHLAIRRQITARKLRIIEALFGTE